MPHPECRDFLGRKHGVMTQVEIEKSALIRTGEASVDVEESELSRVWMPILTIEALYSNRDNLRCRAHLFAADSAANPLVSVQEAPDQVVSSILPHLHAFSETGVEAKAALFGTPPSRSVLAGRLCAYECAYEYSTVLVTTRVQCQLRESIVARGCSTVRA
ncbi:hypothetical protein V8C44DRAFT_236785 [Trichoderma aethiopicum]